MHWTNADDMDYDQVCHRIPDVSGVLASAVNDLFETDIKPDKVSLVGFSLGAHVVGIAGQKTHKKVGRVVGWYL